MSKLIQNAVKIIENENFLYLNSFYRHDYCSYSFSDGSTVIIDGGCGLADGGHYTRGNGPLDRPGKCENWSLWDKSSLKEIRSKLLWGSRGKSGKEPFKYSPFAELELDHLRAILDYKNKFKIPLAGIQIKVINYWIKQKSKK